MRASARNAFERMADAGIGAVLVLSRQRTVIGRLHREARIAAVAHGTHAEIAQCALGQRVVGTGHEQVGIAAAGGDIGLVIDAGIDAAIDGDTRLRLDITCHAQRQVSHGNARTAHGAGSPGELFSCRCFHADLRCV